MQHHNFHNQITKVLVIQSIGAGGFVAVRFAD